MLRMVYMYKGQECMILADPVSMWHTWWALKDHTEIVVVSIRGVRHGNQVKLTGGLQHYQASV